MNRTDVPYTITMIGKMSLHFTVDFFFSSQLTARFKYSKATARTRLEKESTQMWNIGQHDCFAKGSVSTIAQEISKWIKTTRYLKYANYLPIRNRFSRFFFSLHCFACFSIHFLLLYVIFDPQTHSRMVWNSSLTIMDLYSSSLLLLLCSNGDAIIYLFIIHVCCGQMGRSKQNITN